MRKFASRLIKDELRRRGVETIPATQLERLKDKARIHDAWDPAFDFEFMTAMPASLHPMLLGLMKKSRSQLRQDLFVLSELGADRPGWFVEFGATDGCHLSNSNLLEKELGWHGIVAEPARCWHASLHRNRHCAIETRCVWHRTGETLSFNEVDIAELSTIRQFSDADMHTEARQRGQTYPVHTISLTDLLIAHDAPSVIDYLSIDTEGSEFEILNSFDFQRHKFRVITCEHNFTACRDQIHSLLVAHGYRRKFEELSRFDDWYVLAD